MAWHLTITDAEVKGGRRKAKGEKEPPPLIGGIVKWLFNAIELIVAKSQLNYRHYRPISRWKLMKGDWSQRQSNEWMRMREIEWIGQRGETRLLNVAAFNKENSAAKKEGRGSDSHSLSSWSSHCRKSLCSPGCVRLSIGWLFNRVAAARTVCVFLIPLLH